MNRKICVLGMGYIGLPTAALLANKGYQVRGVDIIKNTINLINRGETHIVEPELDVFVHEAIKSGKLRVYDKPSQADVFIIAVPTPFRDNNTPNTDYVLNAFDSILPYLKNEDLIILESTSPIGTTEILQQRLADTEFGALNVYLAHCPERVLPGHIMMELVKNDRIIGGINSKSTQVAMDFYRTFVEGNVIPTNAKTAEMTKLTENSFRDVNIAFANEISILCDKLGIDAIELIALANRHPRVNILQPGVGVGGHCIAVDPWFLIYAGGNYAKMIETARQVNTNKTQWVFEKIKSTVLEFEIKSKRKPVIACMGLSYKPNIDDLRESPALFVTQKLISEGFNVLVVEPNLQDHKDFKLVDCKSAVECADIVVYLVSHNEFKSLNAEIELNFCGLMKDEND